MTRIPTPWEFAGLPRDVYESRVLDRDRSRVPRRSKMSDVSRWMSHQGWLGRWANKKSAQIQPQLHYLASQAVYQAVLRYWPSLAGREGRTDSAVESAKDSITRALGGFEMPVPGEFGVLGPLVTTAIDAVVARRGRTVSAAEVSEEICSHLGVR